MGREEIESRERRGSRKSDSESVDCGALARLVQSLYRIRATVCTWARVYHLSRDTRISGEPVATQMIRDHEGPREIEMIRDVDPQ